ncbi:hypothetical protein ACJX0J_014787, partial [Zea mays]
NEQAIANSLIYIISVGAFIIGIMDKDAISWASMMQMMKKTKKPYIVGDITKWLKIAIHARRYDFRMFASLLDCLALFQILILIHIYFWNIIGKALALSLLTNLIYHAAGMPAGSQIGNERFSVVLAAYVIETFLELSTSALSMFRLFKLLISLSHFGFGGQIP